MSQRTPLPGPPWPRGGKNFVTDHVHAINFELPCFSRWRLCVLKILLWTVKSSIQCECSDLLAIQCSGTTASPKGVHINTSSQSALPLDQHSDDWVKQMTWAHGVLLVLAYGLCSVCHYVLYCGCLAARTAIPESESTHFYCKSCSQAEGTQTCMRDLASMNLCWIS